MSWIKMREELHEDPAILQIAEVLQTRPEHIVGYCHRFWGYVSRNCHNGVLHNVTLESIERVLGLPNFLSLLVKVGWLEYIESESGRQIIIPKFDRHLSEGAKSRALAAERQRISRSQKRHASVTESCDRIVTREDKIREDKNKRRNKERNKERKSPPSSFESEFLSKISDPAARSLAEQWLAYKAERSESYRPQGLQAFVSRFASNIETHGLSVISDRVQRAMSSGWRGYEHDMPERISMEDF